eukprot:g8.t1
MQPPSKTIHCHPLAAYEDRVDALALLERLRGYLLQTRVETLPSVLKELPHDGDELGFCCRSEQTIGLKLRDTELFFLSFPDLVATLCHELAHLETGLEHGKKFYKSVLHHVKLLDSRGELHLARRLRQEIFNAILEGDKLRVTCLLQHVFPADTKNAPASLWQHPDRGATGADCSVLDYAVEYKQPKILAILCKRVFSRTLLRQALALAERGCGGPAGGSGGVLGMPAPDHAEAKKSCVGILRKRIEALDQIRGAERSALFGEVEKRRENGGMMSSTLTTGFFGNSPGGGAHQPTASSLAKTTNFSELSTGPGAGGGTYYKHTFYV